MSVLKLQLVEAARLLALKVHDLLKQHSRGAEKEFSASTPDGQVTVAVYGRNRNYTAGSTWVQWFRADGRKARKHIGQILNDQADKDEVWLRALQRVPLRVVTAAEQLARDLERSVPREA